MYVYAVIEAKYYMLDSSSSIIRRQRFLINNQTHQRFTTQSMMSGPALGVLRSITPSLDPTSHEGQAGKIAVIGGCCEYTGAPYFSAISALKIFGPLTLASFVLILIMGPANNHPMGNWAVFKDCVSDIIKHARKSNISIVIDGVRGQTLQAHKRLVQKVLHCEVMIKMFLSNYYCLPNGSPTMLGCISGSALVRKAALLAFENKRRLTLTGDIVLGKKFGGNLPSELI